MTLKSASNDPALADRHAAPDAAVPSAPAAPAYAPWIPIRSLAPRHRERIIQHLLGLNERDRYLRFGYPASDEHVARYVNGLDFDRDEVFGVFNRRLELIALAHLAYPSISTPVLPGAEFGGSVLACARGRGYGARLFEHAMLHARNRGLDTLFIHALSENTAMLRIARKAGAKVERAGSESDAYLTLPHDTLASQMEQWVGDGAAEIDYRLKQQARIVDTLIDVITEVKAGIGKSTGRAAKD
jgi:RimJ/RimL family protein N-acetyltransferase